MADGVPITAGSGTTILTDDCGASGHAQGVKLAYSADGVATFVTADADGMLVNLGANNDVTVTSGSITANAGTNLNTSLLALEAGGNLAGAATSLAILDDWDESDRAKVNLIVGQAGIAAGTGVDGATVPRVTLATDVPLPSGTNAIGKLAANSGVDIGDCDVLTINGVAPAFGSGARGATVQRVTIATDDSVPVTNAGTFAVQVDGSALTSLQLADDTVFADDAAFTIATSRLNAVGGYVVAHGSNPDAADAGDAAVILMNRHRMPFVIGGHPNVVTIKHTTITTAVTDAAIITVSTGTKIVVTRISLSLDNASTVFPTVIIGFGTANTPTTTQVLYSHGGYPAGGSNTVGDGSGILGIGADNEDLRVTTTGNATGNGLQICVSYYTIES